MLPIRTRRQLTLATLTILAVAAALSVAYSQPSAARPAAVETLALEPTLGTIPGTTSPVLAYRVWMPMVAADCGGGDCGE